MQSIWKNKDFVWLVTGQTLSQFGSAINNFSMPWLLLQITGSAMQMGFIIAVGFVPYLLLSLPAGVWADRYDRKKMMMTADVGRLLLLLSLPVAYLLGHMFILQLYIIQAGMSAFSALFDAAYGACLPSLVGRDQLKQANAAIQSGMYTSQVLGPALGGAIVGLIGAPFTILITAFTYFISIVSLIQIRKPFKVIPISSIRPKSQMFTQIKEGFQYVWNHKLIRVTGIFGTFANFVIFSTNIALYYRIQHEMHLPSQVAGFIHALFSGGSVLGSFINSNLSKKFRLPTILSCLLPLQIVPPFIVAFTHSSFFIGAAYAFAGFLLSIWNIQITSLRQSVIPDEILGRALTSIRLVSWGSIPVGNSVGGAVSQMFGTSVVFVTEGIIRIGMLVIGIPIFRQELKEAKFTDIAA